MVCRRICSVERENGEPAERSQLEVLLGSVCSLPPSLDPIESKRGDAAMYNNASDLLAASFTVISRVQRHNYPDRREGLHSI
jgi:hypothetical protein